MLLKWTKIDKRKCAARGFVIINKGIHTFSLSFFFLNWIGIFLFLEIFENQVKQQWAINGIFCWNRITPQIAIGKWRRKLMAVSAVEIKRILFLWAFECCVFGRRGESYTQQHMSVKHSCHCGNVLLCVYIREPSLLHAAAPVSAGRRTGEVICI